MKALCLIVALALAGCAMTYDVVQVGPFRVSREVTNNQPSTFITLTSGRLVPFDT